MNSFEEIALRLKSAETALKERTQELEAVNKELYALAVQLAEVETVERKRFAELLHEGIGQNLVIIKLAFDNCSSGCCDKGVVYGFTIGEIKDLLDETIKATRRMVCSVYPAPLKKYGLVDALNWYVESLLVPGGVAVSFDMDEIIDSLPKRVQGALFSIVRESFQNICKYASATEVTVCCAVVGRSVRLTIADNGVGFAPGEVSAGEGGGIGQSLMRKWASGIGGELKVESAPGAGTVVSVEFVPE